MKLVKVRLLVTDEEAGYLSENETLLSLDQIVNDPDVILSKKGIQNRAYTVLGTCIKAGSKNKPLRLYIKKEFVKNN